MRSVRKIRTIGIIVAALAICLVGNAAQAKYGGGSGTPADPYQIWTAEQMNAIGTEPNDWDKHFKLMADIDLLDLVWDPCGFSLNIIAPDIDPKADKFQGISFTGVFDGNGHTISGFLYHAGRQNYAGLFGHVEGPHGQVKNLGLIASHLTAQADWGTGLLVGWNSGCISHCYATGTIEGWSNVGGLVGTNTGKVIRCHSTVEADGDGAVGGLVGDNSGSVTHCYSTTTVQGRTGIGVLVGGNRGLVAHCYSAGKATGSGSVGGLVGYNRDTVVGSFSTAGADANSEVGGLVGWNSHGAVIACYSTGEIHSHGPYGGGLVGLNGEGMVDCCYSTGSVIGDPPYAAYAAGGLVGFWGSSGTGGTVSRSFWDVETSGQARSDGGTGLTTAQMQDVRIYLDSGWDWIEETANGTSQFWQMPEDGGYPVLSIFNGYRPVQLRGLGTARNPYWIADAMELGAVVYHDPHAHYQLIVPIDLSATKWGMAVTPWFAGVFEGSDLAISHLTVTGTGHLGLFRRLQPEAQVKDLWVTDVNIAGLNDYVGALAGVNDGTVTNCHTSGAVAGAGDYLGGLVGINRGDVSACSNSAAVNGAGRYVGGLIGRNDGGRVGRCRNAGKVDGHSRVGGLIGSHSSQVDMAQCCNIGSVYGTGEYVGGLIGAGSGKIVNCYSTGGVTALGSQVGGLMGLNTATLIHCYSSGAVEGSSEYIGGLVGRGEAMTRGGLMVGEVVRCFWDTEASGQATSVGGTGKRRSEMQTVGPYFDAGWDFVGETTNGTEGIWWILEGQGYPRLWWEVEEKRDGTADER